MSRDSTLVLEGQDIEIDDLDLDGALVIRACKGATVRLKGLRIRNSGWPLVNLDPEGNHSEVDAMRGFLIDRDERQATVMEFLEPGAYAPGQAD